MNEKKVYAAIAAVTAKLAKEGISKDRKNEMQGYKFRGIDDVYNALAPFLAEAKLCILPCVQSRECVERVTAKGGAIFYVTVCVDFAFVSAEDGSEHHVVTYGEAMDSGDKATNKAMSAAYKYACMQAFCIPTEGDNDADATTHDVKPNGMKKAFSAPHKPTDGAEERVDPERRAFVQLVASTMKEHLKANRDWDAYAQIETNNIEDADEKVYLWSMFDSKERRRLKEQGMLSQQGVPQARGA